MEKRREVTGREERKTCERTTWWECLGKNRWRCKWIREKEKREEIMEKDKKEYRKKVKEVEKEEEKLRGRGGEVAKEKGEGGRGKGGRDGGTARERRVGTGHIDRQLESMLIA